jgi:hypothetical protein
MKNSIIPSIRVSEELKTSLLSFVTEDFKLSDVVRQALREFVVNRSGSCSKSNLFPNDCPWECKIKISNINFHFQNLHNLDYI